MHLFRRPRTTIPPGSRRQARPTLEMLEDRAVPTGSTFFVTLAGDAGVGSGGMGDFRYCLQQANSTPGKDSIVFSISGTVSLQSALPAIIDDVDIVGMGPQMTVLQRPAAATAFRILT